MRLGRPLRPSNVISSLRRTANRANLLSSSLRHHSERYQRLRRESNRIGPGILEYPVFSNSEVNPFIIFINKATMCRTIR